MENKDIKSGSADTELDQQFLLELAAAMGLGRLNEFPPALEITEEQIPDVTRWLDHE